MSLYFGIIEVDNSILRRYKITSIANSIYGFTEEIEKKEMKLMKTMTLKKIKNTQTGYIVEFYDNINECVIELALYYDGNFYGHNSGEGSAWTHWERCDYGLIKSRWSHARPDGEVDETSYTLFNGIKLNAVCHYS